LSQALFTHGPSTARVVAEMGEDHWNYWWYFGLALIARR
jgi:hypothetical protein